MRFLVALVLTGALAVVGCGDDEETNGTGGTGGTGATGGTGGTGGGTGGAGGGMGAAPVITNIAWETGAGCEQFTASDYTVTVTATDAEDDSTELTYAGSVTNCGAIDAMVSMFSCPNNAPYGGTVVVTDTDGNPSAEATFSIGVCETASCDGTPGTPCSL